MKQGSFPLPNLSLHSRRRRQKLADGTGKYYSAGYFNAAGKRQSPLSSAAAAARKICAADPG